MKNLRTHYLPSEPARDTISPGWPQTWTACVARKGESARRPNALGKTMTGSITTNIKKHQDSTALSPLELYKRHPVWWPGVWQQKFIRNLTTEISSGAISSPNNMIPWERHHWDKADGSFRTLSLRLNKQFRSVFTTDTPSAANKKVYGQCYPRNIYFTEWVKVVCS